MKKLSLVAALLLAGLASLPAQAATSNTNASFTVNITLTSGCTISTAPGAMNISYTAGMAGGASATTPVGVTCTKNLPYDLVLSATSGLGATAVANPVTSSVAALTYNLNLVPGGLGAGPASTTSQLLGNTGNGAAQTYTVGAYLGQQYGTCATTTCTGSDTYYLNVNY